MTVEVTVEQSLFRFGWLFMVNYEEFAGLANSKAT